jgi:16S rRNA (guanine1516-N2)-methyltransferase
MSPSIGTSEPDLAHDTGVALRPDADLLLERAGGRLQLRDKRPGAPGPLWVDFGSADLRRRLRQGARLPLARAVGVSRDRRPDVLDATAGLARDSWTLAALGCRVTACERSALLAALVRDGLTRADPATSARFTLVVADACEWMSGLAKPEGPEVVYLDPMFPERGGSAQVRKQAQYLRALLGPEDASGLWEAALGCATGRVVVKRPLHAPTGHVPPNHTLKGKTVRFDVYLARC